MGDNPQWKYKEDFELFIAISDEGEIRFATDGDLCGIDGNVIDLHEKFSSPEKAKRWLESVEDVTSLPVFEGDEDALWGDVKIIAEIAE